MLYNFLLYIINLHFAGKVGRDNEKNWKWLSRINVPQIWRIVWTASQWWMEWNKIWDDFFWIVTWIDKLYLKIAEPRLPTLNFTASWTFTAMKNNLYQKVKIPSTSNTKKAKSSNIFSITHKRWKFLPFVTLMYSTYPF